MTKAPIHILGAGPAGLSAAISLAKAGREVHLHERYDAIGKRFQGDLQGLENWTTENDVLQLLHSYGIEANFEATPFCEVTFTDGKKAFQDQSKEPLFYLVKRGPFPDSLDSGLRQQAINHEVQIHYRSLFSENSADIIATGPIRQSLIAADKGLVFHTNLPNMAIGIFHDDLAYLGYSYLLIAQGYGCLCTVVFKEFQHLNKCFERTIEAAKRFANINLDKATPVGGIGSFSLNHSFTKGNALLVGEAAGLQDLLWGFGIRTAITSGHLAAQSLLLNEDYGKLIESSLYPNLKASLVNRHLWEILKWKSRPLLPFLIRTGLPLRKKFGCLYNYSFFHRCLYPFSLRYIKKHYPHSIEEKMKDER